MVYWDHERDQSGDPVYLLELETRRVADKAKMDWEIKKNNNKKH